MTRILGIDPSLTSTGVIGLHKLNIVLRETIKSKLVGIPRVATVVDRLAWVIHQVRPDLAVLEGYSYGSRFRREQLGEMGGAIRLELYRQKVSYVDVAPATLKKFVTGKGRGDKSVMLLQTYKKWGVEFDDDNQMDAYGLARLGWILERLRCGKLALGDLTKVEREVVQTAIKGVPNVGGMSWRKPTH